MARKQTPIEQVERVPSRGEIALDVAFQANEKVVQLLLPRDSDQARITELRAKARESRALER